MSRYDDLRPLVDRWRGATAALCRDAQVLPSFLAESLRAHLGCPARAVDPDGVSHVLVAPCAARWDGPAPAGRLALTPYEHPPQWTPYDDARFYFGLRVLLAGAGVDWPKDPFWIVLSATRADAAFSVRDENSGEDFPVRTEHAASADALCAHLYAAMRRELSAPPHLRADRQPIGFGIAPAAGA